MNQEVKNFMQVFTFNIIVTLSFGFSFQFGSDLSTFFFGGFGSLTFLTLLE